MMGPTDAEHAEYAEHNDYTKRRQEIRLNLLRWNVVLTLGLAAIGITQIYRHAAYYRTHPNWWIRIELACAAINVLNALITFVQSRRATGEYQRQRDLLLDHLQQQVAELTLNEVEGALGVQTGLEPPQQPIIEVVQRRDERRFRDH